MNLGLPKHNVPISDRIMSLDWYKFFVRLSDGLSYSSSTLTASTIIANGGFYEVDATAGPVVVTISASLVNKYPTVTVKKIDATANSVTVATQVGTIDGAASLSWSTQWQSYTLYPSPSNNGSWGIV